MAQHGHLTRQEKKIIRQKRRALRKDLKKRGIRSRKEFEIMAQQMGLVYGSDKWLVGPFWRFLELLGEHWLAILLGLLAAILALIYGYSALNHRKEDFTIAVSGDLQRIGFDLSETEDFKDPKVRLTSDMLKKANAISASSLPDNLDKKEGSHNGENYMAYTFWIRNRGEETVGYDWHLVLNEVTKNVDDALWIMIYDEGKQTIYAKAPKGAKAEKLSGYAEYPLYKQAAHPKKQYYTNEKGEKGIATTPYVADREAAAGTVTTFKPGEKHKYTVVMWMEGDDPDCINKTMGGKAVFAFKFAVTGDEKGIFDDIINKEDDYIKDTGQTQQNSKNPFSSLFQKN